LIYSSAKALVGSAAITSFTDEAWNEFTFTGGPTITSGQVYYLGMVSESWSGVDIYYNVTAFGLINDDSGTYASPPDPLDVAGDANYQTIGGMYITN